MMTGDPDCIVALTGRVCLCIRPHCCSFMIGTAFIALEHAGGFEMDGLRVITGLGASFSQLAHINANCYMMHNEALVNMGTAFSNLREIGGGFDFR